MRKIIVILFLSMLAGCSANTIENDISEKKSEQIKEAEETEEIVLEVITQSEDMSVDDNDNPNKIIKIFATVLNLRDNFSVDSNILGTVALNDEFEVISEEFDEYNRVWYQIKLSDEITGWIAGWYCDVVGSESTKIESYVPIVCEIRFFGLYDGNTWTTVHKGVELIDDEYRFKIYNRNSLMGIYDSTNLLKQDKINRVEFDTENVLYDSTFAIACDWNPLKREVKYFTSTLDEYPIINTVLKDNNISSEPTDVNITSADIDNDGDIESIIYITNITDEKLDDFVDMDYENETAEGVIGEVYSILFIQEEDSYTELLNSDGSISLFDVGFIGDIDNDEAYEISVRADYLDVLHIEGYGFVCYYIFDDNYELIGERWVYVF